MPISNEIPTLSFASATRLLTAKVKANVPALLIGDPGVGKTALVNAIGEAVGLPVVVLMGSTLDPTDVGGIPFQSREGGVERFPLEAVRRAAREPVLLFMDEISCATPAVQASLLRVMLERVAGDTKLHPGTRILAACNPPEQAPGGFELSAPLTGRVSMFKFKPTVVEVLHYFSDILGDDGSNLQAEAQDFALTCGAQPNLLQIDIPPDCIVGGTPWAAPRNWERGLRSRAALRDMGGTQEEMSLALESDVGKKSSQIYEGIMKLRHVLPTVADIVADPINAKLPANKDEQVAALGVIAHVAKENSWAGWLYASRLERPEYRQAAAKVLQRVPASPMTMKWGKEGVPARVKMIGSLPRLK